MTGTISGEAPVPPLAAPCHYHHSSTHDDQDSKPPWYAATLQPSPGGGVMLATTGSAAHPQETMYPLHNSHGKRSIQEDEELYEKRLRLTIGEGPESHSKEQAAVTTTPPEKEEEEEVSITFPILDYSPHEGSSINSKGQVDRRKLVGSRDLKSLSIKLPWDDDGDEEEIDEPLTPLAQFEPLPQLASVDTTTVINLRLDQAQCLVVIYY